MSCKNYSDGNACPLVPWKTTFDNKQQSTWCPYTQSVDYNLKTVFTGGNDPRVNMMLHIEPFTFLADFREGSELNNSFMGPICMSGDCPKTFCPSQYSRQDPVVDPMNYHIFYPGYTGPAPCRSNMPCTVEDYQPMENKGPILPGVPTPMTSDVSRPILPGVPTPNIPRNFF